MKFKLACKFSNQIKQYNIILIAHKFKMFSVKPVLTRAHFSSRQEFTAVCSNPHPFLLK